MFFSLFFLLNFSAQAQYSCFGSCCDVNTIQDFEGFSYGQLSNGPGTWIREYGNPYIGDAGCSGAKALTMSGDVMGGGDAVDHNLAVGIAPPFADVFESGKTYCISFCAMGLTPGHTGSILIRAVNAPQTNSNCTGSCQVIGTLAAGFSMGECGEFTFTPTVNYASLIFSVIGNNPNGPTTMSIDEVCISEQSPPCDAAFEYEEQDCGKVQFINLSSGNNLTYDWDIDGQTYTDENPCVNFPFSGTFTITLTVTSADGCQETIIQNIMVNFDDQAPIIDCTSDTTIFIPFGQPCEVTMLLPPVLVSDDDDPSPILRCFLDGVLNTTPNIPVILGPGLHDVVYEATDACGNLEECFYDIIVTCGTSPCDSIMVMIDTLPAPICYDSTVITGNPCGAVFDPVCGCDGNTYGNACEATEAGVPASTPGECSTNPDNQNCWYAVDLDLKGVALYGIEAEILTPGVIFNTAVIKHNLSLQDNISPTVIGVSGIGWGGIPPGNYDDLLNFCFGNVDSAAQNPQCVVIRHLQRNALDIPVVICTDTLKFHCEPPLVGDTCVLLKEEEVICDPADPSKFTMNFKIENLSPAASFQPTQVVLNSNDPNINLKLCGAPAFISPSGAVGVNLGFPLPPGACSNSLCAEIYTTSPVTAPTQFCFSMTIWDNNECCTSAEEYCVTLEPCCDPCEDRGFVVKPSSGQSGTSSVISLQASKDGTIFNTQASGSDGFGSTLTAGFVNVGSEIIRYDLFVDFDIQKPCPSAVLTNAQLVLSGDVSTGGHMNAGSTIPNCMVLNRVTTPWTEANLFGSFPTVTNVNEMQFGDPDTAIPYDNKTTNVTTLVQDMLNNPGSAHGFRLSTNCGQDHFYKFASREHPMQNLRPKLILTFDDTTCPPVDTFCCHTVDLDNDCPKDFFTKVGIKSITPGVIISSHYTGGTSPTDWSNPTSNSTCIEWEHSSGFIPQGMSNDVINFCLNEIPFGVDSQCVVLNWYADDILGNDSIACADTLKFYCETDYPCVEIIDFDLKDFECEDCCAQPFCRQWLRDTIMRSQNSGCNPIVDYYKFDKAFWNGQCVMIGYVSGAPDGGGEDIFDCQGNVIQSCRAALGIQCNPNAGINVSADLSGVTNIWNCGDVLPPIGTNCNSTTQYYNYDLTFKNSSNHFANRLLIQQIGTPTINVSPAPVVLSPGMNPCDIETVRLTLFGGTARAGDQLKFAVRLEDFGSPDGWCCFEGDTLCVTLPPCDTLPPQIDDCCKDSLAFCNLVNQGWTITKNPQNDCEVTVTAPQFDSCHWFGTNGPEWGDGGFALPSIIPATGTWSHIYSQSGTYNICITVYEGKDVDDFCWNKQMCTPVTVNCGSPCDTLDWSGFSLTVDTLCANGGGNAPDALIKPVIGLVVPDWIEYDFGCDNSNDRIGNSVQQFVWTGLAPGTYPLCAKAYKIINGDTCIFNYQTSFVIEPCIDDSMCTCDKYSDMSIFSTTAGFNIPFNCGDQNIIQLTCADSIGFWVHGDFACTDSCVSNNINWTATNTTNSNVYTGSVPIGLTSGNKGHFDIFLDYNIIDGGVYDMKMTGNCGNDSCVCDVKFNLPDCPPITGSVCDSVSVTTTYDNAVSDSCCWLVTVENNYDANYFKGISFMPESPATISYTSGLSGWTIQNFNSGNAVLFPPTPHISLGTTWAARICIDDYNTIPQLVEMDWLVATPNGCDTVCTDSLYFDCEIQSDPLSDCLSVIADSISCDHDDYCFKVKNNTSPAFTIKSVVFHNLTPSGTTLLPHPVAIPDLAPGATSDWICVQYSNINRGDTMCFELSGHDVDLTNVPYPNTCCTDTIRHCVEIPTCPTTEVGCCDSLLIYGDSNGNIPTRIKQYDGSTFITSYKELAGRTYAVFSKFDGNGNMVWEQQLSKESQLFDFVKDDNGDFLLVGRTTPARIGTTDQNNASIFAKINAAGNPVFVRLYENNGREFFIKIIKHPAPLDPTNSYYVSAIENQDNTANSAFDEFHLYNFDGNGNVNWGIEYTYSGIQNSTDDQWTGMIPLANGNLLIQGDYFPAWKGVLVELDGQNGRVVNSVESDIDMRYFNAVQHPSGKIVVAGSYSYTRNTVFNGGVILLNADLSYAHSIEYQNQGVGSIRQMTIDRNGDIFVTAQDRNKLPIIFKYQVDPTTNRITEIESKYFLDGETDFASPTIWTNQNDPRLYYADARKDNPKSYGDFDIIFGSFDLRLTDSCLVDTLIPSVENKLKHVVSTTEFEKYELPDPEKIELILPNYDWQYLCEDSSDVCCEDQMNFENIASQTTIDFIPGTLDVVVDNPLLGDCYEYSVDWGDGNFSSLTSALTLPVTHTYLSSGSYGVTVLIVEYNDTGEICWEYLTEERVTVSAENILKKNDIQFFPNPFENEFKISIDNPNHKGFDIEVLNIDGQLIAKERIEPNVARKTLRLNRFDSGIYLIKMTDSKGNRATHRMVKIGN